MKANNLKSIQDKILNCNLCKLRLKNEELRNLDRNSIDDGYGVPVPGIGLESAKIMIFGEAPGADEVRKGKPFVNRAGSLLRSCLEEIGVPPSLIYVANVLNCRPPNNDFPSGIAGDEVVRTCLPWARKQIAQIKPQVIVGLGVQPLKYIYQSQENLFDILGQQFKWHINAINFDTIYIPSLHPSFCLSPGRTYSEVLKNELSEEQKIMTLSISEKKDILLRHLSIAYNIVLEQDKKTEVIAIGDVCSNWKSNSEYVYIGRPGKGLDGYYGNPIKVKEKCPICNCLHQEKEDTLECYKIYFVNRIQNDQLFSKNIKKLKGKKLVCFCKPNRCHGDIIADYLDNEGKYE